MKLACSEGIIDTLMGNKGWGWNLVLHTASQSTEKIVRSFVLWPVDTDTQELGTALFKVELPEQNPPFGQIFLSTSSYT